MLVKYLFIPYSYTKIDTEEEYTGNPCEDIPVNEEGDGKEKRNLKNEEKSDRSQK